MAVLISQITARLFFWDKMHVNIIAPLVFERFSRQLWSFCGGKKIVLVIIFPNTCIIFLHIYIFTYIPSAHGPTDLMQVDLLSCRCDKMMGAWGTIDDIYAVDALPWM